MKIQSEYLRIKHRTKLDEAIEDAEKESTDNHVQNIIVCKYSHHLDQRIKYIERKMKNNGTSFVPHTLNDGTL